MKKPKFTNLFRKKKKKTAAELMAEVRPIAADYVSEAYVVYDSMRDIRTDTPEFIQIVYSPLFYLTADDLDEFSERMEKEFGTQAVPLSVQPNSRKIQYLRGRNYPKLFP